MPAAGLVPQIAILAFAGLVIWAAIYDIRHRLIPNSAVLAIAAVYPAYVFAAPQAVEWLTAVVIAAVVLVLGFVLFLLKFRGASLMGAGDTKLLAASALWAGPALFYDLLLIMALAGGVLAAYYWIRQSNRFIAISAWLQSLLLTSAGLQRAAVTEAACAGKPALPQEPTTKLERVILAVSERLNIPHEPLPYGVAISAGALYVAFVLLLGV